MDRRGGRGPQKPHHEENGIEDRQNDEPVDELRRAASRTSGNKQGDRDGWYTLNETCEILGKDAAWIIKRIENGALKATRRNLNPKTGHWHIERKDLRDFIRKYPEDLTGRNVGLVQIVEILTGIVSPEVR